MTTVRDGQRQESAMTLWQAEQSRLAGMVHIMMTVDEDGRPWDVRVGWGLRDAMNAAISYAMREGIDVPNEPERARLAPESGELLDNRGNPTGIFVVSREIQG